MMDSKELRNNIGFIIKEIGLGAIFLIMLIYIFLQFQKVQQEHTSMVEQMLREAQIERGSFLRTLQECCKDDNVVYMSDFDTYKKVEVKNGR